MALLAPKRPRPSRTSKIRPPSAPASRFDDLLRNQSVLLRWLVTILGIIGILVAVEAWELPFRYRLGDYAPDGIAAKTAFGRVDEYFTQRERDEAAERVHPVFQLNPSPLNDLPAELRGDLKNIADATKLDEVPKETRDKFGIAATEPSEATRGIYETLAASVRNAPGSQENRVNTIVTAFEPVVEELKRTGVLTIEELNRTSIRAGRPLVTDQVMIDITRPNHSGLEAMPVKRVLLSELIGPDSRIAQMIESSPALAPLSPLLRRWLGATLGTILQKEPPALKYDNAATQEARSRARLAVKETLNRWNPRDLIIPPGGTIDANGLNILEAESRVLRSRMSLPQRILRLVTIFLMVGVLCALTGYFLHRNERPLFRSASRLAVYITAVVLSLAIGRWLSFDPWRAEVIPLTATVMILAIAYDQVLATITAFGMAALLVLSTTADLSHFVVLMSAAAAAVIPLSTVDSRSKLIKVGFLTGFVYFTVSYGLGVLERQTVGDVWIDVPLLRESLKGAGWCLVTGYLVAGSLPFVESLFGVVTDISLLEMSDVSHPLLQELVRRAPGTYNHSMAVASIGETAADAIGANGLLVRVGAYFHDLGKMLKPFYFIENITEGQRSRHEQLTPAMSALVIIGHVKDGVDLARRENLPRRIIDFIEQHHGTTLVEYFFREATRQAEGSVDHKFDAEESAFRYPGPKPQSREAAVMMLSDAVESASRTLTEPTPKRIESLVHGITLKRLLDGQFDESTLTLNEIRIIEGSLIKSLIGIYHGRIRYPDQKDG